MGDGDVKCVNLHEITGLRDRVVLGLPNGMGTDMTVPTPTTESGRLMELTRPPEPLQNPTDHGHREDDVIARQECRELPFAHGGILFTKRAHGNDLPRRPGGWHHPLWAM